MNINWIYELKALVSPYVYAPIVFLAWIFTLWVAKRLIFLRLKRWAIRSESQWDDILISSLRAPGNILILSSGLWILIHLLPLMDHLDHTMILVLRASIIIAIVLFLDKFFNKAIQQKETKAAFGQVSYGVIKGLVRGFIVGTGILIFLQFMGVSITPILASLGVGSLAVALALQDTLSNFFAGLYITVDKPVRLGDFVRLESGHEGNVTEIGWRCTRILTPQNNTVIIPNNKLIGSYIQNYDIPEKSMAIVVEVGVHYSSDLRYVEKVAIETAKQTLKNVSGGVSIFEPSVRFHTFGESSINFSVVLRVKEFNDQHNVKSEFIKSLHERFAKEKIIIPYPIRTLDIPAEVIKLIK